MTYADGDKMKHTFKTTALLFSVILTSGFSHAADEPTVIEGAYLGQTPPGMTPEVFAPGIISTNGWEYGAVFTPDMNELYYIRWNEETESQEQVVFQKSGNRWHEKVIGARRGTPTFSPDGRIMHLGRAYRERTEDGWSEIKRVGPAFEEFLIMRMTASAKGTYVFDEVGSEDGDSIIRYSRLVDGKREDPQPFGKVINTGKFNVHPFIAPDESYLIWDGQRDSPVRNSDLFISFRQADGSWGEAIKFGDEINTETSEFAAHVSPDGKYLFFNRNVGPDNTDTFWVDAQVIEVLRPKQ